MNVDEALALADHASPMPHLAGEALREALRVLRAELERLRAACHDCGCLYESFGLDLTLPHDEWALVSAGTNGLLCANCICRRAAELPGAIAVRASIEGLTAQKQGQAAARPSGCRNRLRDEGKAYPRSGCAVCKLGGLTGCPYERAPHAHG